MVQTIHLCWFSGEDYPDTVNQCIQTFKEILPEWRIKVWDRQMALGLNIKYIDEAISVKKWAFASDVVRAYALYSEGGLYMDSDIKLLKSPVDLFSNDVCFFSEYHPSMFSKVNVDEYGHHFGNESVEGLGIQAAFIYAEPHKQVFRDILDYYSNRHFIKENGAYEIDILSPSVFAIAAERYGYCYIDKFQTLNDDMVVYPSSYVVGTGFYEICQHSIAVHLCAHSWANRSLFERIRCKLVSVCNACIHTFF